MTRAVIHRREAEVASYEHQTVHGIEGLMRAWRTLLLFILLVCSDAASHPLAFGLADSLVDVFPLEPHLVYSYEFWDSSFSSEYYGSDFITRRGRVRYVILDSTSLDDTTIAWSVREIRDYTFRRASYPPFPPGSDTTYLVKDTVALRLKECLTGRHELSCSGVVWRFPLVHLRDAIRDPMHRYEEGGTQKRIWPWKDTTAFGVYGSFADTVSVSPVVGFFSRRYRDSWTSGYLYGSTYARVDALGDPSEAVIERSPAVRIARLKSNYPNPFNPRTSISFTIARSAHVSLEIIDIQGRILQTLFEGDLKAGDYNVPWDATGRASGAYFCCLRADDFVETLRLVLIR
ncbi:MAG: T9SS type A sorting domain-containing protein [Bacteroidota bacterium]